METNNADLELSNLFDVKGKVALVTGGGKLQCKCGRFLWNELTDRRIRDWPYVRAGTD